MSFLSTLWQPKHVLLARSDLTSEGMSDFFAVAGFFITG